MKTVIEMAMLAKLPVNHPDWADAAIRFATLIAAAEREAVYDQWRACVMADLENGVKWLNENAAAEWRKNYPAQSNLFPAWIETRGTHD